MFSDIYGELYSLFRSVFIMCAMISGVNICIKLSHGDQDGVRNLIKFISVVAGGFIGFSIICTVTGNGPGSGSFGAAAEASSMKSAMLGAMKVVLGTGMLISVAMTTISIMRRDRDGARKVSLWMFGIASGYALLTVLGGI